MTDTRLDHADPPLDEPAPEEEPIGPGVEQGPDIDLNVNGGDVLDEVDDDDGLDNDP